MSEPSSKSPHDPEDGRLWIDGLVASFASGIILNLAPPVGGLGGAGVWGLSYYLSRTVRRSLRTGRGQEKPGDGVLHPTRPNAAPAVPGQESKKLEAKMPNRTPPMPDSMTEDVISGNPLVGYELLAEELATGKRIEPLWLKAWAEHGGDEILAEAAYNRERAGALKLEHDHAALEKAREEAVRSKAAQDAARKEAIKRQAELETIRKQREKWVANRNNKQSELVRWAELNREVHRHLPDNATLVKHAETIAEWIRESDTNPGISNYKLLGAQRKLGILLEEHEKQSSMLPTLSQALQQKQVFAVKKGLEAMGSLRFADINLTPFENYVWVRLWRPLIVTFVTLILIIAGIIAFSARSANVEPNGTQNAMNGDPKGTQNAVAAGPIRNSLGMEFVPVPETKVLFCITETTKGQYREYATAVKGVDGQWENPDWGGKPVSFRDDHPVVNVSYEDAERFCAWLSQKEGKQYRLPTDHERSCAVGIGKQEDAAQSPRGKNGNASGYPWGGKFVVNEITGNYADETAENEGSLPYEKIEGYSDGYGTTAPVKSFRANALEIYDLGGNAWEWCGDWYNSDSGYRVLRGGSWFNANSVDCASGCRNYAHPGARDPNRGFRVVLVVAGSGG